MNARVAVLPTALFVLLSAAPAMAQTAGQERSTLGASQGSQTFSVKGHFSVFAGVGLDLDVIGNVTSPAVGAINGTPAAVKDTVYPDVYARTQHRRYLGASFGFKRKTEIMARYQEANNPSATVAAGVFGSNTNEFPIAFDNYKDRMIEFGIRHYMATPKRSREYFSLLYGLKTVDAISMQMHPPGGAAPTRLYVTSHLPSIGVEFGISLEDGHMGIFLESGARWQKRLTRDDTDLAQYGLQAANDTGARVFMPATVGLHFRF